VEVSDIDFVETTPLFAAPVPPKTPLGSFDYVRRMQDSAIAGFHQEVFQRPIVETKHWRLHTFIVNDPAGIKHIMVDNAANYVKGTIEQRISKIWTDKGPAANEGAEWRQRRQAFSQSFDRGAILASSTHILDAAKRTLDRWSCLPPGTVIEASAEMRAITLEIMSKIVFSADWERLALTMEDASKRYQQERAIYLLDLVPVLDRFWGFYKGYRRRRIFKKLNLAVDQVIAKRAQGDANSDGDFLSRLMKETDPVTGKGLSAHEMHGRIITVLGAGHETVALTLMWIWYLLSQHPLQEAKLHAEVDQVLGGRAPELKDITKLTYTRAVVEEALRLYPPFHTMAWRAALKDDEVCGVRIPKGATITIAPWVLHRHSMLWNDPDRFDPERFSTERSRERSAYAYLPFGLGQRACVGAQLAMTETTLILATLAQHYRLRLLSGQRVEPQGFVLLKARYGMKMTVESRR
jgi:cytochrome P450